MSKQLNQLYEFGEFQLDVAERVLKRGERPVSLTPKAFETLLVLVRRSGHLVEKDELMKQVWAEAFVEEANLARNIWTLRKALGDDEKEHRYIETVPRLGYRFVAPVRVVAEDDAEVMFSRRIRAQIITDEDDLDTTRVAPAQVNPIASFERRRQQPVALRSPVVAERQRSQRPVLFILATIVLAMTGFGLLRWWRYPSAKLDTHAQFQPIRLTKLTSGRALRTAISPDGKQVAYVKDEADGQSLWLRQIAIHSEVQLIAPKKIDYDQVVYARDGDFIYYAANEVSLTGSRGESLRRGSTLYEIPVLGGVPRKIVENVNSRFSLAHDGKRLAFFRDNEAQQEQYLTVIQTDGSGERRAATNKMPDYCWAFLGPVWSPDDSRVACHVARLGQNVGKFVAIRMSDSAREDLTPLEWKLSFAGEWTSDGLIVSAQRRDEDQWQLWLINPTNGTPGRLTNDLNKYHSVSVTADGHSIAAIQSLTLMNIWLVWLSDPVEAKQIEH